jgi:hypothetical protein
MDAGCGADWACSLRLGAPGASTPTASAATRIPASARIAIDHVQERHAKFGVGAHSFNWQRGDVMVVDNVLATHGREPFTGERRILVAMSGVGGVDA